jgi:hypothetical protein
MNEWMKNYQLINQTIKKKDHEFGKMEKPDCTKANAFV